MEDEVKTHTRMHAHMHTLSLSLSPSSSIFHVFAGPLKNAVGESAWCCSEVFDANKVEAKVLGKNENKAVLVVSAFQAYY